MAEGQIELAYQAAAPKVGRVLRNSTCWLRGRQEFCEADEGERGSDRSRPEGPRCWKRRSHLRTVGAVVAKAERWV